MKKYFLIAFSLLFAASISFAQQTDEGTEKQKRNTVTVQKGYYSIYKNSEKLNNRRPVTTVIVNTHTPETNNYNKGFYAIGDNHKNVHRSGKSFIVITPKRPIAGKGYYSVQPQTNRVPLNNMDLSDVATTGVVQTQDSVQLDR